MFFDLTEISGIIPHKHTALSKEAEVLCLKLVVISLALFEAYIPTVVTAESFYWSDGLMISVLIQNILNKIMSLSLPIVPDQEIRLLS